VVSIAVEATAGRVPVVVGANAGSTRDAVAFSRQAEQLGADGVMLAAPYYSLPTHDELFEHFRAVDEAISVPIMIYNYPGRTGVDMEPDMIGRLGQLEHVDYVKESSGEISRMSEITRRFGAGGSEAGQGAVTVFCGCDTGALEAFVLGLKGWVGGVVNVIPRQHVRLHELAVVRGDFNAARELYYQMLPLLSLMEQGGKYTQFCKAGCEMMGQPVGPPRRPLLPPSESELARLREVLGPFLP
jgi:4-hydroxy-tetrahydrodipicolinate synthase